MNEARRADQFNAMTLFEQELDPGAFWPVCADAITERLQLGWRPPKGGWARVSGNGRAEISAPAGQVYIMGACEPMASNIGPQYSLMRIGDGGIDTFTYTDDLAHYRASFNIERRRMHTEIVAGDEMLAARTQLGHELKTFLDTMRPSRIETIRRAGRGILRAMRLARSA